MASPKGTLRKWYLPQGVVKVHSLELASSKVSCQNALLPSRMENIVEPFRLAKSSAGRGIG